MTWNLNIGLMRRGRLLAEESPSDLMKRYESDLLEQVGLQICRLDQVETGEKCKSELEQSEKLKFKSSWKRKNEQGDKLEGEFRLLPTSRIEKGCEENQSLRNTSELKYLKFLQSLRMTWGFTCVIFLILFRYPMLSNNYFKYLKFLVYTNCLAYNLIVLGSL